MKRDLIIAVLATFCLTATLFMILPTESSPAAAEYDPWADMNDDGTINILDISNVAVGFGTSGDPTKNVNIAHCYYYNSPVPFTLMPQDYRQFSEDADHAIDPLFAFKEISFRIWTNGSAKVNLWLTTFHDYFELVGYEEVYKKYDWASKGFVLHVANVDETPIQVQLSVYVST